MFDTNYKDAMDYGLNPLYIVETLQIVIRLTILSLMIGHSLNPLYIVETLQISGSPSREGGRTSSLNPLYIVETLQITHILAVLPLSYE